MSGRTLILFPGALGDAVCAEPAVAVLARRGPVTFCARGGAAAVARLFPARPEVDSLDRAEVAWLFSPVDPAVPPVNSWLDRFARIVSFTGFSDPRARRRLEATGRAVLAPFPRSPLSVHASDHFLRWAAEDATLRSPFPRLSLASPATDGAASGGPPDAAGRRLAIHVGAGARAKRAPTSLLREMALRWRTESGGSVTVICGPAEAGDRDAWKDVADSIVEPPDVAALASVLAGCARWLGHDSGPSHVAAALGRSGVVIFVATSPTEFGPRGSGVRAVRVDRDESLPSATEKVWRALARDLP